MVIRVLVALVVASFVAAGTFARAARADYETTSVYWFGYASTGEYHSTGFDSPCSPTSGSSAEFSGSGAVTVALIDPSGAWRRSNRSNVHPVSVYVTPDTFSQAMSWTKKAYCKNSSFWQISFNVWCGSWYWIQDPPHFSCA